MLDFTVVEKIENIIVGLLGSMDVKAKVSYEESITRGHVFNISCQDSYLLIGRQGLHLHALQTIIQQLVVKQLKPLFPLYFTLDIDDYKQKRDWYLKETAKQAAEKVKMTGRSLSLEPMPNYERRLIHAYIQEHYPNISSESIGFEPNRKIIIKLKNS